MILFKAGIGGPAIYLAIVPDNARIDEIDICVKMFILEGIG
jgi:hypothetical protein